MCAASGMPAPGAKDRKSGATSTSAAQLFEAMRFPPSRSRYAGNVRRSQPTGSVHRRSLGPSICAMRYNALPVAVKLEPTPHPAVPVVY